MPEDPVAYEYTVTLPTEPVARLVAEELAERGHCLVAMRIVDHFILDPTSWWYGKPSRRTEYTGWWDVFTVVRDPPLAAVAQRRAERSETEAVAAIAREHGGVAAGPIIGQVETFLRNFTRVGLTHELDADRTDQIRRAILGGGSVVPAAALPPAVGLRHSAIAGGGRADVGDVEELLGDLFDAALHQDTCSPQTAGMVARFAALAANDRLSDLHRAWVLLYLYLIATVGRRRLGGTADERHALGQPAAETPDEVAARAAVARALPDLAPRWPAESELGRFLLAGLAAACPEAATGLRDGIEGLRGRYAGTDRAATVGLIHALSTADLPAVEAALREDRYRRDGRDSPYAAPEHRALGVLEDQLTAELERT